MKRLLSRFSMLLALLALTMVLAVTASAAGETIEVKVPAEYNQTEARSALKVLNDFRASKDAYYTRADGTKYFYYKNGKSSLKPLSYDYGLEKIAMQRAAELALNFSHTRPDGTMYTTAGNTWGAESILIHRGSGGCDAEDAIMVWREEGLPYDKQPHRRGMLNPNFTTVGMACVEVNGVIYWVQEFGSETMSSKKTAAVDSEKDVSVDVLKGSIIQLELVSLEKKFSVVWGESKDIPLVKAELSVQGSEAGRCPVLLNPTWKVVKGRDNASVKGGKVQGLKAGSATLLGTVLAKTEYEQQVVATVTVKRAPISGLTVKLAKTSYTYDGKAKRPAVKVTDADGNTVSGENYTVQYDSGRKAVGQYTVTVTGQGNYKGTVKLTFKINPAKTAIVRTAAKKGGFAVRWKKVGGVSGYQLQYSLQKDFSTRKTVTIAGNATFNKSVKKLKGGKIYYIRLRSYKTVDGKKYYSGWTAAESVRTKK